MKFRSGTLERSVRRWGRFPKTPYKRKQHSWQYVELEESSIGRDGSTDDVVLFNGDDWKTGANADNVRNVSIDFYIGVCWTPESTTVAYDSWLFKTGIFVMDADDVNPVIDTMFATTRALWWGAGARNTGEQPTAQGISPESRLMTWRVRARQRFLKFDEELRLCWAFASNVTETLADVRGNLFGRISWETP